MKRNLKIILLIVIMAGLMILPVHAKGDSNFQAGDNLNVKESINATSFIAGNNIEVTSKIDGAGFIAGNNLKLSSKQDILFAAGNVINVENVETKDAFIAGSSITITESEIRDLYVAGDSIRIDSDIKRNAYLGGNSITINGTINGNANISAENIEIGKDAIINGTLTYDEDSTIHIEEGAQVGKTEIVKNNNTVKVEVNPASIILEKLFSYVTMLVTGLVLIVLNQKVMKKIAKMKSDSGTIAKMVGFGFLFLIITPIVSIILLCTIIGIPLSIISLLLYGILIYLSIIPTSYYLGNILLKEKMENEHFIFTVSLLIIYLLKMIPVIGGLISFLSLCLGLGIDVKLIKEYITSKK